MSNGKTICTVCNYIYDEALGEPIQGIAPSLKFEELPDKWKCPECGSAKDMFQPCSCISLPIYVGTRAARHAHQEAWTNGAAVVEAMVCHRIRSAPTVMISDFLGTGPPLLSFP